MTSNPYFPFHALGLQGNPFRVLSDKEWAEIAVIPETIVETLDADALHWQILGEAGRGKTTTLLGLTAHLGRVGQQTAYEYLPEGARRFQTGLRSLDVFLLDEAQRLTGKERRRLFSDASKGSVRLILSSHEDLSPLFARQKLPLRAIRLDDPAPALLDTILNRRVAYFTLPEASPISFTSEAVDYLTAVFGSNLRAMEQFLYEVFQDFAKEGRLEERITDAQLRRGATRI